MKKPGPVPQRIILNCHQCRQPYAVRPRRAAVSRFCDRECQAEYYRAQAVKPCLNCQKEIPHKPSDAERTKFCSRKCASEFKTVPTDCANCGRGLRVRRSQLSGKLACLNKFCDKACYKSFVEKTALAFKDQRPCASCKKILPLTEFNGNGRAYKSRAHCRDCERDKRAAVRLAVLAGYGGRCACCGESQPEFLAIDHINGGGGKERKAGLTYQKFYRFILENNFPSDYQILCHNCNMAKAFYGECPHRRNGKGQIELGVANVNR
jgi:hypothetical protein